MALKQQRRAVGVFSNRHDAEIALRELRDSGFPMDRVSVITQDTDKRDDIAGADVSGDVRERADKTADETKADEGAKTGALTGGALGGITGLLVGLGALAIPGLGPIMLAGATATALATTLAGTAIGAAAGSLLGGLIGLGIPEERARVYHDRVSRGGYLIIVEGTDDEIHRAQAILHNRGIEEWGVYDHPHGDRPVVHRRRAIGVFPNLPDAEAALRDLRDSGFPLSQVSLVARDYDRRNHIPGIHIHDRFDHDRFGFLGDRFRPFHDRFNRGEYLVTVDGTEDEIRRAEAIMNRHRIHDWGIFDAPDFDRVGYATPGSALVHHKRAIGVFPNLPDAEAALRDLRDSGFPLSQVSLVARDYDRRNHIPGIHIHDRFDNDRFGFLGNRFRPFHDRFNRGEYLVTVDGTEDEIRRAEAIMNRHRIHDWGIFDAPDFDRDRVGYATPSTPRSALVHNKRAVGVFPHRRNAEAAIHELRDAGFPMRQVSLVGRDTNGTGRAGDLADRTKVDEGAKGGAATGAAVGGLGGLLVGLGALAIPGIGPVIAGGALATALATAAAGGAVGAAAGGLTGALVGLGIPDDRARHYNDRVNRGDYLVMVDGTEDEIRRAEAILRRHHIQDWDIFNVRDDDRYSRDYATPGTHRPGTGRRYRGVGVFPHRRNAEAAIHDLRNAGFPMDRLSVVGKHAGDDSIAGVEMHDRATGNKADEGAKGGAAAGAALGGLGGLLVGLGALAIPGIGPVIAGGALATALATTVAGGAIGAAAGGLTGALVGLGIPEERARFYNDRVNRGDYLVMLDGDEAELRRYEPILARHGVQDWGLYDTGDVSAAHDHTPDVHRDRADYVAAAPGTHRPGVGRRHRAVGVFPNRGAAEAALRDLRDSGFSMNQVSLVGKHTDGAHAGDIADRTKVDEGAKGGAATGAALGGLGGLLVGLGALAIPGIGPVIAGGALATALATTAAGGAIGAAAGGLTGALVGLGIPDDRARHYNDRVNRGDYLVMVDGTEDEIRRADTILNRHHVQDWGVFDAPSGDRVHHGTTTTATRTTIQPDVTPGTTGRDREIGTDHPDVIIVDHRDHRDQTL